MFEEQKQALAKVRAKLSVLCPISDAFQTALDTPKLEPHMRTVLIQWRKPLIDHITEQRAQETNLLRIIGEN